MNAFTWLVILVVACIIISAISVMMNGSSSNRTRNKTTYRYQLRKHLMTSREEDFFKTLNEIFQDRWYVIPQVGLPSLLNHEIKGQNWNGAFQHINRKTVDYVLLSKSDLSVVCAIELDDSTHDSPARRKRDAEVENIFQNVKLPLVRFRNISKLSKQDIVNRIAESIQSYK